MEKTRQKPYEENVDIDRGYAWVILAGKYILAERTRSGYYGMAEDKDRVCITDSLRKVGAST